MNTSFDCKTVSRLLSDSLEHELDPDDRVRLMLHFGVCEACRNVDQHMSLLHRAMNAIDEGRTEPQRRRFALSRAFHLEESTMSHQRVLEVAVYLQPNDGEPIRSVIHETSDAAVVAWTVKPGQRISPHVHPSGQDTWTIIAGEGQYQIDASGTTVPIAAGQVAIAPVGAVHGVLNTGSQALVFVSVVSPALSGFELV